VGLAWTYALDVRPASWDDSLGGGTQAAGHRQWDTTSGMKTSHIKSLEAKDLGKAKTGMGQNGTNSGLIRHKLNAEEKKLGESDDD
jgi:hypothetical protein